MIENIKAGGDIMAGDGGYSESTRERYEAAVEERIKSLETNLKIMAAERMDERIKLLTEQANEYAWKMNPEEDSYGRAAYPKKFHHDRDTKFAELIIRECIATIKNNTNASLNIDNFRDEQKQGIQLGLEFAVTDICEHFGIEE